MEVINGLVISMIPPLTFSQITRWAALSGLNKLWPWFVAGFFLPVVVMIILCRPVRVRKVQQPSLKPVTSEEIFDRVLELEVPVRSHESGILFSARA